MEVVEQQLREGSYGGLKAREARLKERHDAHVSGKEAQEVRRLAQLKLAEKEAQEAHVGARQTASSAEVETPEGLRRELDEIAEKLPEVATLSVVANMAQVTIEETPFRKLTAKLQFPENYPETAVTVHTQSATLAEGLLERLAASANSAVAAKRGKPHAAVATDLLVKFVASNCLATAYNDLAQLRDFFAENNSRNGDKFDAAPAPSRSSSTASKGQNPRGSIDSDSTKSCPGSARSSVDCGNINCALEQAKQSSGEVAMVLRAGNYFMHVRAVVPKGYPAEALNIEVSDSNLPDALVRLEAAKITDIAQKMAEYRTPESDVQAAQARAGAGEAATSKAEKLAREGKQTVVSFNKGQHLAHAAKERNEATQKRRAAEAQVFVARPSLFLCVEHLCMQFLFPLATGHCAVCSKRLLPADSKKLGKVPAEMQVLKIYCGHHYHFACVDQHLSEPPFGKTCHKCGVPIEHRALTTDVKVLEARWAAKQAKQRELDEIADFLS